MSTFTPTTKLSGGTISTEFSWHFTFINLKKSAPTLRDKNDEEGRKNKKKTKGSIVTSSSEDGYVDYNSYVVTYLYLYGLLKTQLLLISRSLL